LFSTDDFENWEIWMFRLLFSMMIIGILVASCSSLNKKFNLKDDNVVEEFVEEQIENQLGLNIDLTPESKE